VSLYDRIAPLLVWTAEDYQPLLVAGRRMGWLRRETAARLLDFPLAFEPEGEGVALKAGLDTPEARSAALEEVLHELIAAGEIRRLRGELYPLIRRWGEEPLGLVDRRAAPLLGIRCFGIHVNGYVEKAEGLHIWVGRRAPDKAIAPDQYDHLVAGGQPAGLSLEDNLVKEAAEEADLPEELARRAAPVGAVTYRCDWPDGCKDDVLFCYDLELPEDFTPKNTDGEVAHFELWPVEEVIAELREADSFKFNVGPVVIDFLIRRGILTPENEPDYLRLCASLRSAPPD
jgi:hypothetical protein